MIKRWITDKLHKSLGQVPAVALLGARQVGKTTLAKTIAHGMESPPTSTWRLRKICSSSAILWDI